jgi:hypothetical protein
MGADAFKHCVDEFGQAHAGQAVSTDQFRAHLAKSADKKAVEIVERWLVDEVQADFKSHNPWTIFSHEVEPDRVLVVYGTTRDRAAQKEAAEHLRTEVARRFANLLPPVKSDEGVTDEELSSHYLLLVGRPETNRVCARVAEKSSNFPAKFGPQSFVLHDETYAHPQTSVVAAGENPFNPRYSAVMFAGLSATSTWRCVRDMPETTEPQPQIILHVAGKRTRYFHVSHTK